MSWRIHVMLSRPAAAWGCIAKFSSARVAAAMSDTTGESINSSTAANLAESEAKSKNQLKNDKKREEKMAKFLAKQEKMKSSEAAASKSAKPKTLNIKVESFEDKTVPGEKKGINTLKFLLSYIV